MWGQAMPLAVAARWSTRTPIAVLTAALIAVAALCFASSAGASAFPGSNGRIVFDQTTGTGINAPTSTQIVSANADGSGQHVLTSGQPAIDPRVSADGKWIVFVRCCFPSSVNSPSAGHVMIMRADGSDVTDLSLLATPNIESTPFNDTDPSLSPDGGTVVFERTNISQAQDIGIFKMSVALPSSGAPSAGAATQITNGTDFSPTVSSDGKLAFARTASDGNSASIYLAPSICAYPCTTARQLTSPGSSGSSYYDHPDFSPDGTEVVFDGNFGSAPSGLFEVSTSGGSPVELIGNPPRGLYEHPSFSPDGGQIVFDENTLTVGPGGSPTHSLLTMAATPGATPTVIPGMGGTPTVSNADPDWSIATTTLRSTETDAGCPTQVVGTGTTCSVSVTDTAGGTPSWPRGSVSWSSSSGGPSGFSNGGSCQLQPDPSNPAVSSCDIDYASPDTDTATDQIALTYTPSDTVHAPSTESIQASVIAPPQAATLGPSYVSSNEIDLAGSVTNAESLDTHYYFQYGPDLDHMVYDQPTYPGKDIGSSATPSQPVPVTATLSGLSPNTTYCFRLIAVNAAGTTYAHDAGSGDPGTNNGRCQQTSGPPIAPQVVTGTGSVLSNGSLDFFGTVNPENQPTKWFIQYSVYQDDSYADGSKGQKVGGEVPAHDPGQDLGSAGITPVPVGSVVSGLPLGTTYWFRVVASNASGTTYGTSVAVRPLSLQASHTSDPRFELSGQGASPGQQVSIGVTPTFATGPTHGASVNTSAQADSLGHFSVSLAQGEFSGFVRGGYTAVASQPGHADASSAFALGGRPLDLAVADGGSNTFTIKIQGADPYSVVDIAVKRPGGDAIDQWQRRADGDGIIQLQVNRGPGTSFPAGSYVATGTTRHEGDASFAFKLVDQATAATAVARSNKYVALGDSYSSGVGTYTDTLDGGCRQSDDAYAPRLAAKRDFKLTFKACSGATTADVEGQLGALGSDTGYVSLSVGGNNVGFADVVRTCATDLKGTNCQGAIDTATAAAGAPLAKALDALFSKIAADAPNAEIVVLGYPRPFDNAGTACFGRAYFISQREAQQMNAADDVLDATIKAAAENHGFQFINPTSAFAGHDICAAKNWINGIDVSNQTESFHPTVGGQTEFLDLMTGRLQVTRRGVGTAGFQCADLDAPGTAREGPAISGSVLRLRRRRYRRIQPRVLEQGRKLQPAEEGCRGAVRGEEPARDRTIAGMELELQADRFHRTASVPAGPVARTRGVP